MEVHVRNVPVQGTEVGLNKFLKPHFSNLGIKNVYCQKKRNKTFASLTFMNFADGQMFLDRYGQVRGAPGVRRPRQNSLMTVKLMFLNKPIYCEKSIRSPDEHLLRVLEKEAIERRKITELGTAHGQDNGSHLLPLSFECESVSCGIRSYDNSDLVFAPQLTWNFKGVAKFGHRALILKLESNKRIDFRYFGAQEITMEDGAFTFSMHEPPHIFEMISDPLSELMEGLGLSGKVPNPPKRDGPNRRRCASFDDNHKPIIGSCLVYRIGLKRSNQLLDHDRMQTLQKALPQIVRRYTKILPSLEPYAVSLIRLQRTLSRLSLGLPFPVAFQVQKLVQNAYLTPSIVADLLPEITQIAERSGLAVCVGALKKLFPTIQFPTLDVDPTEFRLDSLIDRLREKEELCKNDGLLLEDAQRSENVAIIHRAKVTPSSVFLYGPEPETMNRVLRKYADFHDCFLRVQFCDEDGMPVRFNSRVSNYSIFHERFKDVLTKGIQIADRKYGFLGFSHSSLRAQTCWFVAPFIYNNVLFWDRIIIRELGDFENIRSPAKCAARIGQTFSDTPVTVKIDPNIVKKMEDVEFENRVFSDGVGTMSSALVQRIWDRLPKAARKRPTCFQIRYAGAKGMISLDTRLQGEALVLRPSMIKFEGSNKTDIEICESAYRPLSVYLNRQFIKILEDMGVDESFFLKLQKKEVDRLRLVTASPTNASTFLKRQSIGDAIHLPWLINSLTRLNLNFQLDGFLRNVVELTFLTELRMLKHKTRIPVEKGYHLHGIMDEYGILEEGQIFCTVQVEGVNTAIVGKKLIISRAPALHPGDVQIVEGIKLPHNSPLAQLANCVVFSRKGSRDLPSKLSGGDLDGDRYYVIWDEGCRPKRTFKPADYPRQEPVDIGRLVETRDMTDFFIQFMETDQLGRIAVLHRVLADQRPAGTLDADCLTLAEMHSTAVDFSKTGIPVDMSKLPRYTPWRPDFEAPGPYINILKNEGLDFEPSSNVDPDVVADDDDDFSGYRYYESKKVLGKLYRAIDEREVYNEIKERSKAIKPSNSTTLIHAVWFYVERRCKLIQWKHLKEWACELQEQYEECLLTIMTEYSDHPLRPLSEVEAFVGNILGRTGAQSKRQRELSTSLKEKFEFDSAFFVECIVKNGDGWSEEALERSIACLAVSLEPKSGVVRGEQLLSFKYIAAAVCLREVDRTLNGL